MACRDCDCPDCTQCQCHFDDSDCFTVDGDGSVADPFVVDPIIDPDADNMLSCGPSGLLAEPPAYILNPPACHVFNSANISIPNDTATALTFNSERYDTDTMHSTATLTGRITIVTEGIYIVTADNVWDKNAVGDRATFIRKNGADFLGLTSVHAGDADLFVGQSVTVQEYLIVGDWLDVVVKQDSGGALSVLAERDSLNFSAMFRRRAP